MQKQIQKYTSKLLLELAIKVQSVPQVPLCFVWPNCFFFQFQMICYQTVLQLFIADQTAAYFSNFE